MAKKRKDNEDDRSLIEISNDSGDHWVADIPTDGQGEARKIMRQGKVELDRDEQLSREFGGRRQIERRDPNQHRYRMERVVDEGEDLEDSYDQENDTSDEERSEQSPTWP